MPFYCVDPAIVRVAPTNLREGRPDETLIDVAAVGICGSDLLP
jgi:L-iditol 2-dehydrogenase